jgi:RHS repeat-associated protein
MRTSVNLANLVPFDGYQSLFGFTGQAQDSNTGLQNNLNRWYNASLGNWMSQDPLGLGPDSNPYRYVGNSPTNYTDPKGTNIHPLRDLPPRHPFPFGPGSGPFPFPKIVPPPPLPGAPELPTLPFDTCPDDNEPPKKLPPPPPPDQTPPSPQQPQH